jgi:hypothetical protein
MAEVKASRWQPWTPSFLRALKAIPPGRDKTATRSVMLPHLLPRLRCLITLTWLHSLSQARSYRALNRWVKTETFGYCNKEAELTGKMALLELWARVCTSSFQTNDLSNDGSTQSVLDK